MKWFREHFWNKEGENKADTKCEMLLKEGGEDKLWEAVEGKHRTRTLPLCVNVFGVTTHTHTERYTHNHYKHT